jgi:hypothetical protein
LFGSSKGTLSLDVAVSRSSPYIDPASHASLWLQSLVMLLSKLYSALMITRLLGRMDRPPSSSKNPRILLVVISVMQSVTSLSMKTSQTD